MSSAVVCDWCRGRPPVRFVELVLVDGGEPVELYVCTGCAIACEPCECGGSPACERCGDGELEELRP